MPSVRLDYIKDPRFSSLGMSIGSDEFAAIGRMAAIYEYCTDKERSVLSALEIDGIARIKGFAQMVVAADLAEPADGGFRIKGTVGRIEWIRAKRENGKKGGEASAKQRGGESKQNSSEWQASAQAIGQANGNPKVLKSKVLKSKDLNEEEHKTPDLPETQDPPPLPTPENSSSGVRLVPKQDLLEGTEIEEIKKRHGFTATNFEKWLVIVKGDAAFLAATLAAWDAECDASPMFMDRPPVVRFSQYMHKRLSERSREKAKRKPEVLNL